MVERYKNGKIYKLVNNYNDKIYYGSTCCPLSKRLHRHRNHKLKSVVGMVDNLYDLKIILVENYPCETKEQLLMRERYYIDNFECVNKCVPITTKEENKQKDKLRYENNKEHILNTGKIYREKNKEKRKKITNCPCGGKYQYSNKSQHLKSIIHKTYLKNNN